MKGEYTLEFYSEQLLDMNTQGFIEKHYWKVTAANNEIIGKSEQGFVSEQGAKDNFALLVSLGES